MFLSYLAIKIWNAVLTFCNPQNARKFNYIIMRYSITDTLLRIHKLLISRWGTLTSMYMQTCRVQRSIQVV